MKKSKRKPKIHLCNRKTVHCVTIKNKNTHNKKRHADYLIIVSWIIVPLIIALFVVLDALGIYTFNTERLIVLGIGLIIILLPFFNEITLKDISLKQNKSKDDT